MAGTAALHIFCNQVSNMCKRKFVMNHVGSYCTVTENKRFLLSSLAGLIQANGIVYVDQIVLRHLFFTNSIFKFIICDF